MVFAKEPKMVMTKRVVFAKRPKGGQDGKRGVDKRGPSESGNRTRKLTGIRRDARRGRERTSAGG